MLGRFLVILEQLGYKIGIGMTFKVDGPTIYHLILTKGKKEEKFDIKKRTYKKVYKFITKKKEG